KGHPDHKIYPYLLRGLLIDRPNQVWSPSTFPKAPAGFRVDMLADGLSTPRVNRVAPDGDIFVTESGAGRVRVFRTDEKNAKLVRSEVFAENLPRVFGIAFYPSGHNRHSIYVATEGSVARLPYRVGDLKAPGLVHSLCRTCRPAARTGHAIWRFRLTIGRCLFRSALRAPAAQLPSPLADREQYRADVLAFDPEGGHKRVFATGCQSQLLGPDRPTIERRALVRRQRARRPGR